jgi:hypothetical protein
MDIEKFKESGICISDNHSDNFIPQPDRMIRFYFPNYFSVTMSVSSIYELLKREYGGIGKNDLSYSITPKIESAK